MKSPHPLASLDQIFTGVSQSIQGGASLIISGDPATALYIVRRGLFAVCAPGPENRLVGLVGLGEPIGEMALLRGAAHHHNVLAMRDSVVDRIDVATFMALSATRPEIVSELASIALRRNLGNMMPRVPSRTVALTSVVPGLDCDRLADALAKAARDHGLKSEVIGESTALGDDWLARAEAGSDLVILKCSTSRPEWAESCRRQADRVLLYGRLEDEPPLDCAVCESELIQQFQRVDLVLERAAGQPIRNTSRWATRTRAARQFHVDDGGRGVDRLLRIITGRSVGLALSGGGARAFAHIGVVRAIREKGIPIDLVCGTSMGAIVAAGVALGWDDEEMDAHMRQAFVETSPLDDIALPIIAMTRGRKVDMRLLEHLGDGDILDLELPYFCVSSDLTIGHHRRHDRGALARAVRASIALPGILPPVIDDGSVLVDGGVLRNLPTDLLRTAHEGLIIGSDVSRDVAVGESDIESPKSWLRWFLSGAWRKGPPIVSVLMRSATLAGGSEVRAARAATDIYIMPDVSGVEIRNWQAYEHAVKAGYAAASIEPALDDLPAAFARLS